jgi:hypothetical protein
VVACFFILAYGVPGCSVDEYTMVRKSTIIEPFRAFIMVVVHVFVDKYLKAPNAEDTARCNECFVFEVEELHNSLEMAVRRAC